MAPNVKSFPFIKLLIGFYLLALSSVAQSALMFTGNMVDVSYTGPDFSPGTDSIIAGASTPDIAYLDGSNIGDGLMIDFESITFSDYTLTFEIRGDGDEFASGYQKTGLLGSYVITLDTLGVAFESVFVSTSSNVTGLGLNSGITFDTKNIYFDLSDFGILDQSGVDLATVNMHVTFIPVPAALPLMLSGIAGLLLLNRRRKAH